MMFDLEAPAPRHLLRPRKPWPGYVVDVVDGVLVYYDTPKPPQLASYSWFQHVHERGSQRSWADAICRRPFGVTIREVEHVEWRIGGAIMAQHEVVQLDDHTVRRKPKRRKR